MTKTRQVLEKLKGVPLDGRPLELALVGVAAPAPSQPKSAGTRVTITGLDQFQPGPVRGGMMGNPMMAFRGGRWVGITCRVWGTGCEDHGLRLCCTV
jgi:hypothetical protein